MMVEHKISYMVKANIGLLPKEPMARVGHGHDATTVASVLQAFQRVGRMKVTRLVGPAPYMYKMGISTGWWWWQMRVSQDGKNSSCLYYYSMVPTRRPMPRGNRGNTCTTSWALCPRIRTRPCACRCAKTCKSCFESGKVPKRRPATKQARNHNNLGHPRPATRFRQEKRWLRIPYGTIP